MNKPNLSNMIKMIKVGTMKHSPEILTGIGIAGMISTTILAVKATPKALRLIDEARCKKERETTEHNCKVNKVSECVSSDLKPIEVVKAAWKPYIPAVISGTVSIACLVGANSVNARRNAALATAYKLSETALTEYKSKVVETIGEKKEETVRKAITKDKVDSNPVSKNQVIMTSGGETLFLDGISGRYFKSDLESIKSAVNEVNRTMTYDNYISLSEFYDEIGLTHTDVSDDLGWNLDDGLLEIHYDTAISDDGRPCIVLNYHVAPRYDFAKLM